MRLHLLLTTTLVWASGCFEPGLRGGWPAGRSAVESEQRPAGQTAVRTIDRGTLEEPPAMVDLYLLYLVRNGTSVPEGPCIRTVRLGSAEPPKAAWLVTWLTEPVGSGGGKDRQFILYSDPLVWALGAEMAELVDTELSGHGRTGALAKAVRLLYSLSEARVTDPETFKEVLEALEPLYEGHAEPGQQNWMACMLAGRVLGEGLGKWQEAAKRFARAAKAAAQRSEAWLVAMWSQAHALSEAGRKSDAQDVANHIVQRTAKKHKTAWAYRKASALLSNRY